MEKPVMPNPETMTEAEFDKWLEDEYLFLFGKIQHINSKAKQSRGFLGC